MHPTHDALPAPRSYGGKERNVLADHLDLFHVSTKTNTGNTQVIFFQNGFSGEYKVANSGKYRYTYENEDSLEREGVICTHDRVCADGSLSIDSGIGDVMLKVLDTPY